MTRTMEVAAPHRTVPTDEERRVALRRMKRLATSLLIVAAAVFAVAFPLQDQVPWMGFVRAAAEGAMVGAIADWFAVTALFRHPLGLPIPHTAIIPENKDRIADTMAGFLRDNFLVPHVVARRLSGMNLAAAAGDFLTDRAGRGKSASSPERLHAGAEGPEIGLIQAASIPGNWSRPHHILGAQVGEAAEMPLAQSLDGCPALGVEPLRLPHRLDHRELREQHELRRVGRGVLAQGCPRVGERIGLVRQLADSDSHAPPPPGNPGRTCHPERSEGSANRGSDPGAVDPSLRSG